MTTHENYDELREAVAEAIHRATWEYHDVKHLRLDRSESEQERHEPVWDDNPYKRDLYLARADAALRVIAERLPEPSGKAGIDSEYDFGCADGYNDALSVVRALLTGEAS